MTLEPFGADKGGARRGLFAVIAVVAGALLLFLAAPAGFYPWAKAFHVIAVISWMAGMLYLPRLFVYHAETEPGSRQSETFKRMEGRLLRIIINPAMVLTWVFGVYLAWQGFGFSAGWLHLKFLFVIVLSGLHGYFASAVRHFRDDRNLRSARHWRLMNEVPALLMIAIVILVVVKPF